MKHTAEEYEAKALEQTIRAEVWGYGDASTYLLAIAQVYATLALAAATEAKL